MQRKPRPHRNVISRPSSRWGLAVVAVVAVVAAVEGAAQHEELLAASAGLLPTGIARTSRTGR